MTLHLISLSSSGPGAYAPDAVQPVGLLGKPVTPRVFRRSHCRHQMSPESFSTREIQAAKGGTYGREFYTRILPKCRIPRYI
jgi:hypothetical protein